MNPKDVNPRVLLWARAEGYGIDTVFDRIGKPGAAVPRTPNGTPWTVEFIEWTQKRWREFHLLHGRGSHHDCIVCSTATTDGSFDAWLETWVTEAT